MRLYMIRHGQFVGNIVEEDTPDGPLTDLGRIEAESTAYALQDEGLTHILASPLMRGLETATEIAGKSRMRFTVWKDTYEYRTKGLYIGPSLNILKEHYPLADFEADMESDGWVCGGVETPADVNERARKIAHRLLCEFAPTDKVVLVSHAGFNNVLLGALLGISDPHAVKFKQSNCGINVLRFTEDRVHVESINATDHIKAAKMAVKEGPQDRPA